MLMINLNHQMSYSFLKHYLNLLMTKAQEKNIRYSDFLATSGVSYEIRTERHQFIHSAAGI